MTEHLPTDEVLDRALAEWKAHARQGNGDGAKRVELAPAPTPDRRRLIQAASELASRKAPKTKQAAYRQRLAAAGRCTRCGGEVDPGHPLCPTHRRYERRHSMLRRHQKTLDEVVGLLRSNPTFLGPEGAPEFQAGVFLLLMFRSLSPPTAALLADLSDADRDAMLARLTENGIYHRSASGHVTWRGDFLNKETGAIEFAMTVGVALGIFVRILEPSEAPAHRAGKKERKLASKQASKPSALRSHVRRPPEDCLLCRRVKGLCRRHGGPNRSTSFRGAASGCSYCRRPKGHAPTCGRRRE